MLYCEAKLPRGGLGNRLFPWARCRIYSQLHGLPVLGPRWTQVPFGTILRRERDPRIYADLFIHRAGDIAGWRRTYVTLRATRIAEPEALSTAPPGEHGLGIVVFEGFGEQFKRLHGWHDVIRAELIAMTKPKWQARAAMVPGPYVALHVRRGDFQRSGGNAEYTRVDNTATPLSWFVDSLQAVRAQLDNAIPAIVTSDGSLDELRGLLQMENVRLVSTSSAIGDLLVLSRAVLLVASGSSFSAWASYLGCMPTLSHPGQSLTRLFQLKGAAKQFIGEFDPSDRVPEPLLRNLRTLICERATPACIGTNLGRERHLPREASEF